jgi:hypothetical protein
MCAVMNAVIKVFLWKKFAILLKTPEITKILPPGLGNRIVFLNYYIAIILIPPD